MKVETVDAGTVTDGGVFRVGAQFYRNPHLAARAMGWNGSCDLKLTRLVVHLGTEEALVLKPEIDPDSGELK